MKELLFGQIANAQAPLTPRQLSEDNQCPLETVQAALDALAGEGYRFVTVSDLLIDGPSEILHDGTQRALPPAPESAG